jgi:hypothetical protein
MQQFVGKLLIIASFWHVDGFCGLNPFARGLTRAKLSMANSFDVSMPALSSTMKEGKIVEWLKSVGDKIEAGDVLMVVESDKVRLDKKNDA